MSLAPAALNPRQLLGRPSAQVTLGNLASRITGLARVVAVGAVLGTTFLGNTYQSSNLVSNILFELLAAGLLSSVLVPPFVGMIDDGRRLEAQQLAGAVLGVCLAVLGAVTVVGIVARVWVMRALTVAVTQPAIRTQEVRLGSLLLVFFLPQVMLYAVGAVATALLHGSRRFMAAAFAPVANNILVIATMAVFWSARHGLPASRGGSGVSLPTSQTLVLAVGTTAGVVAMTAVAVTALRRSGMRLRPRWEPSHPEVARLRRAGAWAAGFLALNQLLVATTMVLANRVEGGVVAFQIAFTFFLVPHALLAHPVLTALYPRLAAEGHGRRWAELAGGVTRGAGTIAFGVLPAAALLVALGRPALHLIQGGALSGAGAGLVSKLLAAYALGLMGYAGLHLLTRASYAAGDTRTPTMVNLGIAGGGAALMIAWSSVARGDDKVVVLGLAHSVVMIAGAIVLWLLLQRRLGHGIHIGASLVRGATCAAAAGLVARVVVDSFGAGSRLGTLVELSLASVAGVGFYLVAQWALRAPELNRFKQRGGHLGPVGPTP